MKIGFIGSGKMASALVGGLLQKGVCRPEEIWVSDAMASLAEALAERTRVHWAKNNGELVRESEVIVVCVKPGDVRGVLEEVRGEVGRERLVISIAAGVGLKLLEEVLGEGARAVRVMPNTPAMVLRGVSGYALGKHATVKDGEVVERVFGAVGVVGLVKEGLLDAVTGLSGSGPAYGYLLIEALADGGVLMGLPRELALRSAAQTLLGAAEMVLQTGLHPAVLRDAVTSPGGTTAAGLEVLEKGAVRAALQGAVRAAAERAQVLGKQ